MDIYSIRTTKSITIDRINTPLNESVKRCAHWLQRKKRYCKMVVRNNSNFCGQHEPISNESIVNGRIVCPLDKKHTVYIKNLQKHLRICNAFQKNGIPDYLVANINNGESDIKKEQINNEQCKVFRLSSINSEEQSIVIEKVRNLYNKFLIGKIVALATNHSPLAVELAKTEYGKETRKQLLQASALLGILEDEKWIRDNTSFLEFGAGKGQLAFFVAKILEKANCYKSKIILIDRKSLRHKKDNKIENRSLVLRIRADIADLCIDKLTDIENSHYLVVISKHLCGAATDLALRCITQAKQLSDFIMIALCCHHCCDWSSFAGKEFLTSHNINEREFAIIIKMVSWAVCGTGMSREHRQRLAEQQQQQQEQLQNTTDEFYVNCTKRFTMIERESIGLMCKRLLDYARLDYLKSHGYEASLKYYVPKDVTPENTILIARKKIPN